MIKTKGSRQKKDGRSRAFSCSHADLASAHDKRSNYPSYNTTVRPPGISSVCLFHPGLSPNAEPWESSSNAVFSSDVCLTCPIPGIPPTDAGAQRAKPEKTQARKRSGEGAPGDSRVRSPRIHIPAIPRSSLRQARAPVMLGRQKAWPRNEMITKIRARHPIS